MEWMLQVVDEIDDVVCAGRQRCANVLCELGHVPLALGGVAALVGGLAMGAQPVLMGAAIVTATFAALLRARSASTP